MLPEFGGLSVAVLQAILELAVDDKLIARNPARSVKTLPSIRHRKNVDLEERRGRIRAEVSKNSQERSVGYPAFMHYRFRELVLATDPHGALIPSVHDLRHSAASFAVSEGASLKVVQNMLGHSSAAMTLDVYSDLFDTDVDDVAERMDAARKRSMGKTWAEGDSAAGDE